MQKEKESSSLNSERIPTVQTLKQEFLVHNTGKYITENNLGRSDVEKNPGRYIIMNGMDKDHDPSLVRGTVYEKDSAAYYPNPPKGDEYVTSSVPQTSQAATSRYSSSIYSLDQKPYYGQNMDYRVIVNSVSKDKITVPIQLEDLTSHHADQTNLNKLQAQLDSIDKAPALGDLNLSGRYLGDPMPYYDPTVKEKVALKQHLTETIERMKENLSHDNMPNFEFEKINTTPRVQNFINQNREETNEFIKNSYWYGVKKDKNGFEVAGPVGSKTSFDVDSANANIDSYNVNNTDHNTLAKLSNATVTTNSTIASDINELNNQTNPYSNRGNGKEKKAPAPKSTTPADRKKVNTSVKRSRNETEVVVNTTTTNSTTGGKGKYIVEADTPSNNFVEAEDAGTILGKKYYEYNETAASSISKNQNQTIIYDDQKNTNTNTTSKNGTITELETPIFKNNNLFVKRNEDSADKKKNLKPADQKKK